MTDWNLLRTTLIEDIGVPGGRSDQDAMNLIKRVVLLYNAGSTYSLARMDRYPREVRIAVLYQIKSQPPTPMVWVVDKPYGGREWKINARKTLSAMSVP